MVALTKLQLGFLILLTATVSLSAERLVVYLASSNSGCEVAKRSRIQHNSRKNFPILGDGMNW